MSIRLLIYIVGLCILDYNLLQFTGDVVESFVVDIDTRCTHDGAIRDPCSKGVVGGTFHAQGENCTKIISSRGKGRLSSEQPSRAIGTAATSIQSTMWLFKIKGEWEREIGKGNQ